MAMQKPAPKPEPKVEPLAISFSTINTDDGKIAFKVANQKPGYLYILSYGPDQGKMTFVMLEPRFGRSAQRNAGESKRVPEEGGFKPDTPDEKNTPYVVWSGEQVAEMEELKNLDGPHGQPIIRDPAKVASVLQYLQSHHGEARPNAANIDVQTNEKVLVYPVSLERRQ
jgi:hypothetical protein